MRKDQGRSLQLAQHEEVLVTGLWEDEGGGRSARMEEREFTIQILANQ